MNEPTRETRNVSQEHDQLETNSVGEAGVSRREFLKWAGVTGVVAAHSPQWLG